VDGTVDIRVDRGGGEWVVTVWGVVVRVTSELMVLVTPTTCVRCRRYGIIAVSGVTGTPACACVVVLKGEKGGASMGSHLQACVLSLSCPLRKSLRNGSHLQARVLSHQSCSPRATRRARSVAKPFCGAIGVVLCLKRCATWVVVVSVGNGVWVLSERCTKATG